MSNLSDDLELHRAAIGARVPVYDRLLALAREALDGRLGRELEEAWLGRSFFVFWDRPLLLLASLRFDALIEGPGHPLAGALIGPAPRVEAVTARALDAATAPDRERFWASIRSRAVQTNETSRAVAWLWPARIVAEDRPIALVDVGCSAGLNLVADALPKPWLTAAGGPLPLADGSRVVVRLGLDRAPLDPRGGDAATWLQACIWPGETAREERLRAAVEAMRAATERGVAAPVLEAVNLVDAPERLARLDRELDPEACIIAYQTIVREYLSPDERAAYERGMRAWLASIPRGRAVWIELEVSGRPTAELPAALTAHTGAGSFEIARCSYHPREIAVDDAAVDALRHAM